MIPSSPDSPKRRSSIGFRPDVSLRMEEIIGLKVIQDEPMSKHNSLRVGGPASMFVTARTV
ncbi:MAG: hypothetical protein ABIO92_05730, partial [Chloroflexia bacterium]